MQTVLEDTHVLKENVDCIAVYQNIAIPISTVTGNIRVHIICINLIPMQIESWEVQEIGITDNQSTQTSMSPQIEDLYIH
jgi:hypothetical protein